MNSNEEVIYREGFTYRVILITIVTGIVLAPVMVWAILAGIGAFGIAAAFMAMVLFGEIARIFGGSLTAQELATIRWSASAAVTSLAGTGLMYYVFFRSSPITAMMGIADKIPDWVAPLPSSEAVLSRTLFHEDFLIPIALIILSGLFGFLTSWGIGLIVRQIFIVEEKLPWPTGAIAGQLALDMSGRRDPSRFRIFSIAASASAAYTLIITVIMGLQPALDLTPTLSTRLPGAMITFYPTALDYAVALVLGTPYMIGYIISSLISQLIFNPLLVSKGIIPWIPQESWTMLLRDSMLHFWVSPNIGFAIALAIPPLITSVKLLPRGVRSIKRISSIKGSGLVPLNIIILMLAGGYAYSIAITKVLAPDYPVWLALAAIGYSIFFTLISGYTFGQALVVVDIPYLTEFMRVKFYDGVAGWFVAPSFITSAGLTLGIGFKAAEITRTKPTSILKADILGWGIGTIMGLLIISIFWRLYNIPSDVFPVPFWIPQLILQNIWITKKLELILKPSLIIPSFIVGFALSVWPKTYLFAIGLYAGLGSPPLFMFTYLAAIISKKIMAKVFGEEWVNRYVVSIAAGIFAGVSIVQILYLALMFYPRLIWATPY